LWGGNRELIKRGTLIMSLKEGGINMVCLKAKFQSLMLRYFGDIILNNESIEYRTGVYWLKMYINKNKINNFNIVAVGNEKEAPQFYLSLINLFKNFKTYIKKDKEILENFENISVKKFYLIIKKKYEILPKVENIVDEIEWKEVYKSIQDPFVMSELRSFNYKILFSALYTFDKFNLKKNKKKCLFCKDRDETVLHIFSECTVVKSLYQELLPSFGLSYKPQFCYKKEIIYMMDKTSNIREKISIFKYTIWMIRNKIRNGEAFKEDTFWNLYSYFGKAYGRSTG
jgi:hypothetical protein